MGEQEWAEFGNQKETSILWPGLEKLCEHIDGINVIHDTKYRRNLVNRAMELR